MREERQTSTERDVARVSEELAARLRSRNVTVHDSDSPDSILAMVEAVESFEQAVQAAGGDLMVDEPPASGTAQPDDARFLLPPRGDDESAAAYVKRLDAATRSALSDDRG
ncbi:MAG TPA: hypothetical protein VEB19_14705 [Gemmatimonadaceae bacterium]|nr:hypothetical protein [Gemmatimonadaceae bacterium]